MDNPASHTAFKVLLGVTGCIAAYKSCEILRALQKRGCDVEVVMTSSATKFVGEATFSALSGHATITDLFADPKDPIPHISHSQKCDLFLIAPCTGNTLSKIAFGIADNLLTSCALACTAPIMIAPAMNVHMYRNDATQESIAKLRARGVHIIDADHGRLACGDTGDGKLAPVEVIADAAMELLERRAASNGSSVSACMPLEGKRVLITSGPTIEPIDPVRFIANRSSGKMGAALAREASKMGARVTVITGPVNVAYPDDACIVDIQTADEMLSETRKHAAQNDILIFAAAVADFKPKHVFNVKLKKSDNSSVPAPIELIENPDILASIAKDKLSKQIVVGFAAETNDILSNGRSKLLSKNADIIVCNEVGNGKAFGSDENSGWIITADSEEEIPHMPKDDMAKIILDKAVSLLKQ